MGTGFNDTSVLIEPMCELWRSVVEQALDDYRWEPVEMTNQSLYRIKWNAKKTTEWWLRTDDFYKVCEMAFLNADKVLEQFREGE